MNLGRIKSLIDAMTESDLNEMEFSEGGWSLKLVRRPPLGDVPGLKSRLKLAASADERVRPARARLDPTSTTESSGVTAPLFGVVYLRPAPDAPAFISVGQTVTVGTPLCVIEAMKMFHQVRAERDGTISEVLVSSGQEVEAGQELMRLA
jgi:acetyl-CoA carboxylase biotin carboxyl carrier protein